MPFVRPIAVAAAFLGLCAPLVAPVTSVAGDAHVAAAERSVSVALPARGEGRFYKLEITGSVAHGERISDRDFSLQVANLSALPANIRAAYALTRPRVSHGRWTELAWLAINYPRSLSTTSNARAAREGPPPQEDVMNAIVKFSLGGEFGLRAEDARCRAAIEKFLAIQRAAQGVLGAYQSTADEIAHFTDLDCKLHHGRGKS